MAGFWSSTFGGGNSFGESVANTFTPEDGYEYRGGTLYEGDNPLDPSKYGQETPYGTLGQADSSATNQLSYSQSSNNPNSSTAQAGTPTTLGSNATSNRGGIGAITRSPVMMGGLGLITGGLPGLMLGAGGAQIRNNIYGVPQIASPKATELKGDAAIRAAVGEAMGPGKMTTAGMGEGESFFGGRRGPDGYTSGIRTAGEPHDRIRGAFYKKDAKGNVDYNKTFKINAFGSSYEIDTDGQNIGNSSQISRDAAAAMVADDGGINRVRRPAPVGTQATVATSGIAAPSAMSLEAAAGANMPIPDPNYDPTDPMSQKYIVNPTYEQIVAYKKTLLTGMARGGEVESALGGNEKDLINDAEKAIRGELDETRASIILAQYVQQYGEDALRDLVDSIRTGEADDTRERFARGDNGMVLGNGDGSGVDDKVTAQLKDGDATQDVLLADGEFVMRKDATDSLQKAYGGGILDKVNNAGPDAAATLKKYMTA